MNKWYSLLKAALLHSLECASPTLVSYTNAYTAQSAYQLMWYEEYNHVDWIYERESFVIWHKSIQQMYIEKGINDVISNWCRNEFRPEFRHQATQKSVRVQPHCIILFFGSHAYHRVYACLCDSRSCVGIICESESTFTDAFLALIDVVVYIQNEMGQTSTRYACILSQSALLQQ